jgi:hypothetical protein
MRMILPGLRDRRAIRRLLGTFFNEHRQPDFDRAIAAISRFYRLRRPQVEWFEYLDWGKTVGRTYENGKIHLVHPENWKRGRKYNSERQWVNAVYHEMGHYIFWSDAERKANTFAARMERTINGNGNGHVVPRLSSDGNGHGVRRLAANGRRRDH